MNITAYGIICDDIRREDNGKLLVIGAYDGGFVPGSIPSQFPLSLWLTLYGIGVGKHKFKLEVKFPEGSRFETDGELDVLDDVTPASMFFVGFPAAISSVGEIVGTVWIDESEIQFIKVPVFQPERGRS